jgi:hypothetical protein
VIKIILFEGKHFSWVLMMMIETLEVLLSIAEKLSVFVSNISCGSFLLDYFGSDIRVVIGLG